MSTAIFSRANGGRVAFGDAAVNVFARSRQLGVCDAEAGGILIGRRVVESSDVVVDSATEPNIADTRSRFRFFRKARPAQRLVDAAWAASSGSRNYLGDWHTHPEDLPTPSRLDRQDWEEIITNAVFEQEFLLFVIVGRLYTRVWEMSRDRTISILRQTETNVSK
jgi:integrative and conjugative element protein (TIGR02256 family)